MVQWEVQVANCDKCSRLIRKNEKFNFLEWREGTDHNLSNAHDVVRCNSGYL